MLPGARVGHHRFILVSLMLVVLVINSADKATLSLLLADQGFLQTLGIQNDPTAQGALMSVFIIVYGLGNIVFGPLADWVGVRRTVLSMLAVWSGLAMVMGSISSFGLMLVLRGLRGFSDGPVFPTMNRFVRNWFPMAERGRANSIWNGGLSLGMAVTVPIIAIIISSYGWRAGFFVLAGVSLLVGLPMAYLLVHDRPQESRWVGAPEVEYIRQGTETSPGYRGRNWRDARLFIGDYHYWLLVAYHLTSLAIFWGLLTWLPKYLVEARGLQVAQSGVMAFLPYLVAALSTLLSGSLSDRFTRRAPFCAIQMIGGALAIYAAASASSVTTCAILITVAFGFWGLGAATMYSILQRIVPGSVISTGSGIDNGISNLGAAICPALIGYTIGVTGSYFMGLMVLVAIGAVGGLMMIVLTLQDY